MEEKKDIQLKDNRHVQELVKNLLDDCREIKKIFLISVKVNTLGVVTSFKFGLIVDDSVESTSELAAHLYLDIDSELPYDIVIYRESNFEKLKDDTGSFASKINETGTVLYG